VGQSPEFFDLRLLLFVLLRARMFWRRGIADLELL
jgi:hypothetical protein